MKDAMKTLLPVPDNGAAYWGLPDLKRPLFDEAGRVHDWRKYVPENWVAMWEGFTMREREIIFHLCEAQAQAEHWD